LQPEACVEARLFLGTRLDGMGAAAPHQFQALQDVAGLHFNHEDDRVVPHTAVGPDEQKQVGNFIVRRERYFLRAYLQSTSPVWLLNSSRQKSSNESSWPPRLNRTSTLHLSGVWGWGGVVGTAGPSATLRSGRDDKRNGNASN
jgi:hypothetical protein